MYMAYSSRLCSLQTTVRMSLWCMSPWRMSLFFMAHGPWPMAHGLLPMAYGLWSIAYGHSPMAHGPRFYGPWPPVLCPTAPWPLTLRLTSNGPRPSAHYVWRTVYWLPSVISGACPTAPELVACSPWSAVYDRWRMAHDRWVVVAYGPPPMGCSRLVVAYGPGRLVVD